MEQQEQIQVPIEARDPKGGGFCKSLRIARFCLRSKRSPMLGREVLFGEPFGQRHPEVLLPGHQLDHLHLLCSAELPGFQERFRSLFNAFSNILGADVDRCQLLLSRGALAPSQEQKSRRADKQKSILVFFSSSSINITVALIMKMIRNYCHWITSDFEALNGLLEEYIVEGMAKETAAYFWIGHLVFWLVMMQVPGKRGSTAIAVSKAYLICHCRTERGFQTVK